MDPAEFYDVLAPHFHLIHADWEESVARQGEQLGGIIAEYVPGARTVLDCACGIGTQTLGLAARGYELTASDIAQVALARAKKEAAHRSLEIGFSTADMRKLPFDRQFDVVLAADNSVPHLLNDDEILQAFREFRRCTRGLCIVTVRDYDMMERDRVQFQPYAAHRVGDKLYSVYQVRELVGETYVVNLYVVEDGAETNVLVARTRYHAVSTKRLLELFHEAGFMQATRLDGRFFQPLLLAR